MAQWYNDIANEHNSIRDDFICIQADRDERARELGEV